mgnify:CR=1 FL=1
MGKASFSVIAACKTIERPAGLHCDFVCRQFLIQRIFYNDMPIFDFSFPFHSFPVPSFLVLSREQAQQMSTHLPFLACWENPKPFYFPSLNIPFGNRLLLRFSPHYIQHCTFDFAKDFLNIFYKLLLDNLMFICNNSYVTYVLYRT